jgi:DNA-binding PadR family transcriptional regulator
MSHFPDSGPADSVPPRPDRRNQVMKPAMFFLLVSLAAGDRHGYGLRKDVAARSQGQVRLGPASLYRSIATLVDQGLIAESSRRPAAELDDERRRYFKITDRGRRKLAAEARRLEALAAAARDVIGARA